MSLHEIYRTPTPHFENVNPFSIDECSFCPSFHLTTEHFPLQINEPHANSPIHDFPFDLDEFDRMFIDHDAHGMVSETCMNMHTSLILPFQGMEVDNHLSLLNLIVAYAEVMDRNQEITGLSEVIGRSIIKKVNPFGGPTERVLYYMFEHLNKKSNHNYLKEESFKNFYPAFKAFYQIFPYGKFAHLVANSAVMESLPSDAEIIHLIDFDIGEGVQWASFIEAIKHHRRTEVRVTSIKFDEKDESSPFPFEDTKRRLRDHAWSYGLNMIVEEVGFQDFEIFTNNIEKGDYGRKSLYVFNCHVALPHMGRVRSKKHVFEFLRVAENFLNQVTCWGSSTSKGIITYGNGDVFYDKTTTLMSYSTFLDANIAHYQALLESMEFDFPKHLGEARRALEFLFVGPSVSSIVRDRKWEEIRQCGEIEFGLGLDGLELSEESVDEAKEVVKEGVSLYGVRIESEKKNEMVIEWNGVSIVRVCCWKS
ncbi:hypothetical protein ABFS83_10G012300 [Erythranthe nasuta]